MLICAIDLETTGLSAENDVITEIGAVLWDTELNAPVQFFNRLIKIDRPVPELIIKLTGITDHILSTYGESLDSVMSELLHFTASADFFMAHNAPFDRAFLEKQHIKQLPWIDSSVDVPYPELIQTRKLTHLACEHGFVNPFAHRAVTDVLTMCQVVSKYDWNEVISNAKTPNVIMKAFVTFGNNNLAKAAGYRWNADNKSWVKQLKETKVNDEVAKCLAAGFTSKKVG